MRQTTSTNLQGNNVEKQDMQNLESFWLSDFARHCPQLLVGRERIHSPRQSVYVLRAQVSRSSRLKIQAWYFESYIFHRDDGFGGVSSILVAG
jgi:hypothetical protein